MIRKRQWNQSIYFPALMASEERKLARGQNSKMCDRLYFQIILARTRRNSFSRRFPAWEIYRGLLSSQLEKGACAYYPPIRGFSLTVDIVAPLLAIISYVARKRQVPLYSARNHNRVNGRRGKVPQIHTFKTSFVSYLCFREQRACVFARHWVIFVHGRWFSPRK